MGKVTVAVWDCRGPFRTLRLRLCFALRYDSAELAGDHGAGYLGCLGYTPTNRPLSASLCGQGPLSWALRWTATGHDTVQLVIGHVFTISLTGLLTTRWQWGRGKLARHLSTVLFVTGKF